MIPTQLVFAGYGAVARCLFSLIPIKEPSWVGLPIVIIDPRKDLKEDPLLNRETPYTNEITILNDAIDEDTIERLFSEYIISGAVVFDLTYRVYSSKFIRMCDKKGCIYVNTAIDHWERAKKDWETEDAEEYSLAYFRKCITKECSGCKTTAILNHGMNPGLVSHFAKYAIKKLYGEMFGDTSETSYAKMSKKIGLTTIHISERDTQKTKLQVDETHLKNTWSVKGMFDEAIDPVQLGWGTHEKHIPQWVKNSHLKRYGQAFFPLRGMQMKLKSYEPQGGMLIGSCIPHSEAASIPELVNHGNYRISIYYVYLMSDIAKASLHYMEDLNDDYEHYVLKAKDIEDGGYDSVGCLMFYGKNQKVWVGSVQPIERAKEINDEINGTCLQVAVSVLASVIWGLNNPNRGICDPEVLDTDFILDYCKYWMGDFIFKDVTNETTELTDQFYDLLVCPKPDSIEWK